VVVTSPAQLMDYDAMGSTVALLHAVPQVMFCVKNLDGTYASANLAFAARCGKTLVVEVLGKRAFELFPSALAASYEAQDRAVIATQRSVVNQLERIARYNGDVGWFVTTKVAIRRGDEVAGVAVLSVDLHAPVAGASSSVVDKFASVIDGVRNDPGRTWKVSQLAAMADVSPRQLERRMQQLFGTTLKRFLVTSRIDHAASLLTGTRLSLIDISEQCGYYDQSQFTRQFRQHTGLSPGRYRALI
jgi:AraC-like DNA-binding protein